MTEISPKRVLITGGTGLVGRSLIPMLLERGYQVACLSRSARKNDRVDYFQWNVDTGYLEEGALEGVQAIIHLAGANVGEKRWTAQRKREILDSRVKAIALLADKVNASQQRLEAFISASAIGYYGFRTSDHVFTENDAPGTGFLTDVCVAWEGAVDAFEALADRTAIIRVGVVLDTKEGAMPKIALPVKFGAGAALGHGRQYMPWIHVHDLARLFLHSLETQGMCGIYNGVAPEHCTNRGFTKMLGKVLKRPVFLPPVPGFLIRLAMGEMGVIGLEGSRISSEKTAASGFAWDFPTLQEALEDLY
ncbi:MAG: TIGR01777 family oxidoreductase [Bacteroidota bacterium]